jgi:hypothetical protein
MKIILIMILAYVLVWVNSPAHNVFASPGAESPKAQSNVASQGNDIVIKRLESITRRLGLTMEQQAQIKPILQDEVSKLKELRDNHALPMDEKRAKLQDVHMDTYTQIRPILTDEQKKIHDRIIDKIAERKKNQRV